MTFDLNDETTKYLDENGNLVGEINVNNGTKMTLDQIIKYLQDIKLSHPDRRYDGIDSLNVEMSKHDEILVNIYYTPFSCQIVEATENDDDIMTND